MEERFATSDHVQKCQDLPDSSPFSLSDLSGVRSEHRRQRINDRKCVDCSTLRRTQ